jgi:hypothetical protein
MPGVYYSTLIAVAYGRSAKAAELSTKIIQARQLPAQAAT